MEGIITVLQEEKMLLLSGPWQTMNEHHNSIYAQRHKLIQDKL